MSHLLLLYGVCMSYVSVTGSESDGARVLRVALVYKRLLSLDGFLEQMYIPYTFLELVPECYGEIKCNVGIYELLTANAVSLDQQLSVVGQCRIAFRRNLLLPLLHRWAEHL